MLPDFRIRQRDYLLETTRALTEELDLNKVLGRISRISAELLAGRASLIALRQGGEWAVVSSHGIRSDFLKRVQRLLSDVPPQAESVKLELQEVTSRLQRITEAASLGLLASVGLPLIARTEIIGVIFVFRAYPSAFSQQDRDLLQAFASQAAIAVHNASLYTEVAQQKQHLDAMVDSAADGIFILSADYRFTRFNRACSHYTEFEKSEVIGRLHSEVVKLAKVEVGMRLEYELERGWPLKKRKSLYVEGELVQAGGGELSVGITYAPVFDPEGQLLSVIGNLRDITRFREAEELKDTFISVISHELRTPVALIKGYVGTLRREDANWDPNVVRDSLEVIEEEADHLARLIDDLLDASRLQAGALDLVFSEVELEAICERLAERFMIQSPAHTISTSFPHDFPTVQGDEARLQQLLSNLLSNAVKFSAKGDEILIAGGSEDGSVVVCVSDQGPGISPQDTNQVFDRFYRARQAEDSTPGTGLGLYLARAVAEAHGGRIWVDTSVERGAKICFSIPVAHDD
jgi:PAS domain S-box-containing protein